MEQEQMNLEQNENVNKTNVITKIKLLIQSCRINNPIKFWAIAILSSVCLVSFVFSVFELYFIPSIFDEITTNNINYIIKVLSFVYLALLIVYIYVVTFFTINKFAIFILCIIILLLIIYIINSFFLLFKNISDLQGINFGEYCAFIAAISTFLAFVVSFINYTKANKRADKAEQHNKESEKETKDRFIKNNEQTIFFQLLDLHTKKIESVTYTKGNSEITGIKAFKEYAEKANNYLVLYLVTNHIENNPENKIFSKNKQYNDAYMKVKDIYEVYDYKSLKSKIKKTKICGDIIGEKDIEKDTSYIDDPGRFEIWVWAEDIARQLIKKEKYKEINDILNEVYNVLYKEYGHILGHYFRNMYYVMDTIDKFNGNEEYKKKLFSYI